MAEASKPKAEHPKCYGDVFRSVLVRLILRGYVFGEVSYDFSFGVLQLFLKSGPVDEGPEAVAIIQRSHERQSLAVLLGPADILANEDRPLLHNYKIIRSKCWH